MTPKKTTPHFKTGRKPRPALERFWNQVEVKGPNDCWVFKGEPSNLYPRFNVCPGYRTGAHQFSWMIHLKADIPDGYQVDHLCYNTKCVNPAHLEVKTGWENRLRSRNNPVTVGALRERCKYGHEYDSQTVTGARKCKTCKREWTRAKRAGVPFEEWMNTHVDMQAV